MSVLAQQVYNIVAAAPGGRMAYADVQAALAPEDRAYLPTAFREAKKAGMLRQEVSQTEAGTLLHEYIKVQ